MPEITLMQMIGRRSDDVIFLQLASFSESQYLKISVTPDISASEHRSTSAADPECSRSACLQPSQALSHHPSTTPCSFHWPLVAVASDSKHWCSPAKAKMNELPYDIRKSELLCIFEQQHSFTHRDLCRLLSIRASAECCKCTFSKMFSCSLHGCLNYPSCLNYPTSCEVNQSDRSPLTSLINKVFFKNYYSIVLDVFCTILYKPYGLLCLKTSGIMEYAVMSEITFSPYSDVWHMNTTQLSWLVFPWFYKLYMMLLHDRLIR